MTIKVKKDRVIVTWMENKKKKQYNFSQTWLRGEIEKVMKKGKILTSNKEDVKQLQKYVS